MPRAVNSLIDGLFERKYRKVGQEKNALGFFSRRVFCFNIMTPGKGSKYREFYDLSGRITCMTYMQVNPDRMRCSGSTELVRVIGEARIKYLSHFFWTDQFLCLR